MSWHSAAAPSARNFKTPDADKADRYTAEALPAQTVATPVAGGEAQTIKSGSQLPAQWWQLFGSDLISKRIDQAFAHSPSLAAAEAALREAQENAKAANGGYWPSIDLNGQASRQKANTAAAGAGASSGGYIYNLYGASVGVSYTFDIFGGVRRSVEAQRALAEYQQFQYEGAYLTLASNVVTASVREASLQTQVAATEDIIKALEEQQRITEKQYELGAVALTDVLSTRTQLEGTRATLPALRQQLVETRNQLAIYLGQTPTEQDSATLDLGALTLPQEIPLSLPSQLAQQRPDIRAAEAQLHQASAQVGVATANLYPNLTISGSYGAQAASGNLFDAANEVWNIAGGLTAPVSMAANCARASVRRLLRTTRPSPITAKRCCRRSPMSPTVCMRSTTMRRRCSRATSHCKAPTRILIWCSSHTRRVRSAI